MKRYATPMAFKEALEARLRAASRSGGLDQNRLRMRLVMDRFAARVAAEYGDDVVLKGGVVLELGDHLTFEIQPDPRHPTIDAEGMQYEGLRFRVHPRLAGKIYGGPFGLDAAFAESMVGEPELLQGSDFLTFAGVEAPMLRVYPLETHIAEKLHAYTVPRSRPNSRVKDLPDIALLAMVRSIEAEVLLTAIMSTFAHRAVHPMPRAVPDPPESWLEPYARMAQRDQLPWQDIYWLAEAVRNFLDPILEGCNGTWSPDAWGWLVEP